MNDHPGALLFASDVAEVTGFHESQIVQAVVALRTSSEIMNREISVIVAGSCWRYVPFRDGGSTTSALDNGSTPSVQSTPANLAVEPATAETRPAAPPPPEVKARREGLQAQPRNYKLLEEVGRAGDMTILRDEDDQLWEARPLRMEVLRDGG